MRHSLDSGRSGWSAAYSMTTATRAAAVADDDVGPTREPMRSCSGKRTTDDRRDRVNGSPKRPGSRAGRLVSSLLWAGSILLVGWGSSIAAGGANASSRPSCGAAATATFAPGTLAIVEEVGMDGSRSAASRALRDAYRSAAAGIVARAASEHAALRVVVFAASGVGARTVFSGSFASVSEDEVFNLAAANRTRCEALAAIDWALTNGGRGGSGTDVAGAVAGLVADARRMVAPGGSATVTVLTDGCQAPSASGSNRSLTDLCGVLRHGASTTAVLRAHGAEFDLGYARGVSLVMFGVGVGRDPGQANTVFARRLAGFWSVVCRRARARSCRVGSWFS